MERGCPWPPDATMGTAGRARSPAQRPAAVCFNGRVLPVAAGALPAVVMIHPVRVDGRHRRRYPAVNACRRSSKQPASSKRHATLVTHHPVVVRARRHRSHRTVALSLDTTEIVAVLSSSNALGSPRGRSSCSRHRLPRASRGRGQGVVVPVPGACRARRSAGGSRGGRRPLRHRRGDGGRTRRGTPLAAPELLGDGHRLRVEPAEPTGAARRGVRGARIRFQAAPRRRARRSHRAPALRPRPRSGIRSAAGRAVSPRKSRTLTSRGERSRCCR